MQICRNIDDFLVYNLMYDLFNAMIGLLSIDKSYHFFSAVESSSSRHLVLPDQQVKKERITSQP